jgi:hypothetical protein
VREMIMDFMNNKPFDGLLATLAQHAKTAG